MATSDNMTTVPAAPRPTVLKPTPEGSGLDAGVWAVIGLGIAGTVLTLIGLILGLLRYLYGDNIIGRHRKRSTKGRRRHSRCQEEDSEQGIPLNTSMPTAPAGETNATRSKAEQRRAELAAASRCRNALKEIYTSTGSYVQMLPWVDDDQMHIMDIYTKLQLEKGYDGLRGQVNSYWDIFNLKSKEGHPIIRAILRGWAGLGKTTLIDKIAYDWACGSVAALKKYKLVFVLKMHSLQQTSDVKDALFDQLLDEKTVNREDLISFITTNPEDVLFLLDGFDELMSTELDERKFSSILNMLNRKGEYEKCSVLVTTRPSHYDKLVRKTLIQKPFAVVNVLGFSKDDIKEYVNKFYSEEPSKANGLLKRIESPVLFDLAKSPMLLLLMCLLWRESATLPDTMFRLYDKALFYIFKRKVIMSTKEISRLVIAIGKVALDGLLSSDQKLIFQEEDFESDVLDLAIRAGILTSQRVFKDIDICKRVHFIHKTFQEFCAAKCYQSLTSKGETQPFEMFFLQLSEAAGFEYLLRFCCGDNEGPRTNSILNILSHKVKQAGDLDDRHLQLALHCYFESQSQTLPPLELIHSVIVPVPTLCVRIESRDALTSLMYFLHNITDQPQDRGNAYLKNIQSLRTSPVAFLRLRAEYVTRMANLRDFCIIGKLSCLSYNCLSLLNSCLKEMTSLQSVTLRRCGLRSNYMELVVGGLRSLPNLVELDLSDNILLTGSRRSWLYLTEIKTLNKLVLHDCSLSRQDIKYIAVALSNMPNLEELDLSSNVTLTGSGRSLSHLKDIKTLKKLDLSRCNLFRQVIEHIAVAVCNMPNLEELDLSSNILIGSGQSLSRLKDINTLKKLDLRRCGLSRQDIQHIAVAVSNMPNLEELDLSSSYLTGSGESLSHLKDIKTLKKLGLSLCRLSGEDMLHIAVALSNMPNLEVLDLTSNENITGSGQSLSHLKDSKTLKKLGLGDCYLSGEDIQHIAVALSNMPNLEELDLSSNKTLAGSGESVSHLKDIKTLKKLDLSFCSLSGEDIQHIAVALSNMPNLEGLDLSSNTLVGSGRSLCHLKDIKTLKKLILRYCNLSREDIQHIAVALSDMPNLEELVLSSNTLTGSGQSLSHLKDIKTLKKLDLSFCNLSREDIQHLTFKKLDLSYNTALADLDCDFYFRPTTVGSQSGSFLEILL